MQRQIACAAAVLLSASALFAKDVTPPKIFLDKPARIVAYQLKRLDDDRLLLVPRADDDKKYIPVYEAILSRPAMASGVREEAVTALAKLKDTSAAKEILSAIESTKFDSNESRRSGQVLGRMLLRRPAPELDELKKDLSGLAMGDIPASRSFAFAALIAGGNPKAAEELASDAEAKVAMLNAVSLLPRAPQQVARRDYVVTEFASATQPEVSVAAIAALSKIPTEAEDTCKRLMPLLGDPALRVAAARGLMRLPAEVIESNAAENAAEMLVAFAESTDAAKRTTNEFVDVMQLTDRLLTRIAPAKAKTYRARLREIVVRVVKIKTVEEEMRYDVPYFAVEAGRPVQILLENHDLMPHNLVVATPGALKGVAMGGLAAGPDGTNGLPYVPDSPNVIAASDMIAPDKSTRITLTAPTEPGEYPYVCTFPQHWYRMYGVMIVVEDLDAWNQNPTEPANPIGSNRSFVQNWKLDDFEGAFSTDLRGRSPEIGQKIFNEASCAGCHKVNGVGGAVGPELADIYKKHKGDHQIVLREILEPSHTIDAKYAMQLILTVEG
ncbi:MAG: plastocyanin/azurin family copper-binding protein, partial [Planctomycetota bacterium]